jgi:hypothetical protein
MPRGLSYGLPLYQIETGNYLSKKKGLLAEIILWALSVPNPKLLKSDYTPSVVPKVLII